MTLASFDQDRLGDLAHARAFIDQEADLLDRLAYDEWLSLWEPSGRYILPIDRDVIDHAGRLNHIYDDGSMRRQRVDRLMSGHAPSASPIMRTVRTIGRVRLLEADTAMLVVASSLLIISFKRQVQTLLAADVTHRLTRGADGLKIAEKLVLLINSDEPLAEMSFLP
ncbi:aromatic-ring-hydroxylating dioxygenase subunit beta [Sphingopyxis sp. MSC1_008]|uniref:aromatic-ring-hydroxylating dioxygenase subunit beta n=1 Tax=Sphingopyxis sp. MSC1_008 TaxID=2909265 RepID=UPI0020BE5011